MCFVYMNITERQALEEGKETRKSLLTPFEGLIPRAPEFWAGAPESQLYHEGCDSFSESSSHGPELIGCQGVEWTLESGP